MRHPISIGAAFLVLVTALPVLATEYDDPTWPCVQRKVERLSEALMWPYPIPLEAPDPALAPEIDALAEALALRKNELEAIRPQVAVFAEAHGGDSALLGQVFERAFASLAKRRTRVINGIGKFSLGQIALSEKIDEIRAQMDAEMAKDSPDFDKVDKFEETLDWDQTIYSDRQRSITYLCESPQLIERRLYAIAQLLGGYVVEPD